MQETLKDRAIRLSSLRSFLQSSLEEKKFSYQKVISRLNDLNLSIETQSQAIVVFKEIIDLVSRKQIDEVKSLLDSALKAIFYDRDYSVEIEIGEYRGVNKTISFYLLELR